MTDYSPEAQAARGALDRETLAELSRLPTPTAPDRIAAEVMRERLQVAVDQHEAGERLRDLRIIGSPYQAIRQCFDLMATTTVQDWELIATRMVAVPQALRSFEAALREGVSRGVVAARRQALTCADQGATWSGQKDNPAFFPSLVTKYEANRDGDTLRHRLESAAVKASEAYAEASRFLREEYAPRAASRDPVGSERYQLWARAFLGSAIDLMEAYAWGWDELHRIEERMASVGDRILPGESLTAVVDHLENDPERSINGVDAFRRWLQELMDRTVAELDGTHFDIAEPVKRVEAMIAPPGGAAAMYYTRPSEDFKRPGRTWYPTLGRTRFPLWGETWRPELMLAFAVEHGHEPEDFLRSEVDRYLGWPGQAICYKVGERVWLAIREQARQRLGEGFDLKAFHSRALNLGPMGLAQLEREMARV